MTLLAVSYLLTLKLKENTLNSTKSENPNTDNAMNERIRMVQRGIHIAAMIILCVGFLSYMGAKKDEYGKKFSYITFVFGKETCANNGHRLTYIEGLKNAFS